MNQRLVQYSPEMEEEANASDTMPMPALTRSARSGGGVFGEDRLLEWAVELLEADNEVALIRSLGRLIDGAARAVHRRIDPASADALQGTLRHIAQRVLPFAGRVLGAHAAVTPSHQAGTRDDKTIGGAARFFGVELEGLSPEDKEFELAKRFVRLAADVVQRATAPQAAASASPQGRAWRAVADAACHAAPGLFHRTDIDPHQSSGCRGARHSTAANDSKEPDMHDIDRTQMEYSNEQFEFGENEWSPESGGTFNENEEAELANELLAVNNEGELDRFLGDLVSRATQAVGSFVRSPIGQAVGGVLKGVAKKALPMAGTAIGGYFGGPLGAKIGSGLANAASNALGLEGEMANEDREFEGAKQFVRLAADTAAKAAAAPQGADPRAVAQQAAVAAAMQHAPGLLSGTGGPAAQGGPQRGLPNPSLVAAAAHGGRWLRRGNKIVIYGV